MNRTNLECVKEKLSENPFSPLDQLVKELSLADTTIISYVKELVERGDRNAQIWDKTTGLRKRNWRLFAYVLQVYHYFKKNRANIKDIRGVDVYELLTILTPKPARQGRYYTLSKIKK